ncbi:MarR family winged helix-turn-helix transcriptional regulator [Hansschlegelia beijingensis]|uniref:DNA-binding MarR family transcriptional regulator n=1 Tax=Hansschlegelia beijingensis TaxID=1133344 RepID=A0A7W6D3M4_9HYPH|nr:MarR family transcriptional regulator [Hansschlegelia beijingensis]MBB3971564.1 DNA-binding MarR family transcriptional regulator [Hansschlegelia beijingensis]
MADVISAGDDVAAASAPALEAASGAAYDIIELLFFAYRDFVRDADEALAVYGFGRAHHRVLHFVDRNPGLRVTELLDILKITKQSLGRVLRELVDKGFIVQREGEADRRQRLLYVTDRGDRLARELARLQGRRVARALVDAEPAERDAVKRFLFEIIDPEERGKVSRLSGFGADGRR